MQQTLTFTESVWHPQEVLRLSWRHWLVLQHDGSWTQLLCLFIEVLPSLPQLSFCSRLIYHFNYLPVMIFSDPERFMQYYYDISILELQNNNWLFLPWKLATSRFRLCGGTLVLDCLDSDRLEAFSASFGSFHIISVRFKPRLWVDHSWTCSLRPSPYHHVWLALQI